MADRTVPRRLAHVGLVTAAARLHRHPVRDAWLDIDLVEHERRQAMGLSAVTDLGTLDRLLNLPSGELVPWPDFTRAEAKVIQTVPEGVVEISADGVRRVFAPAATVTRVLIRARSWRSGLGAAGSYAPFAERVLLLPEPGRRLADRLWEADYWGIGVWTGTQGEHDELVAPQPYRCRRITAAAWWFREHAYATWLDTIYAGRA